LHDAPRVLVCADAHLGYEDAIGGGAALPLWSTSETIAAIAVAARRHTAREIVFLGDAIHAPTMSAGAARTIGAAFDRLREQAAVTIVAGNHEGRGRGVAVLGATVEACERDGWTLVHGDRPQPGAIRTMIGHLHPALHLASDRSARAFLAAPTLVVAPALTPYSPGLDVLGEEMRAALGAWNLTARECELVVATSERVYPFGRLSTVRGMLRVPSSGAQNPRRRRTLRPDR
jgi:metallophosphoesterase superfamily enzyme